MHYDLYNPTKGARVVYDGITNAKPIRVGPGETLRGVVLADHVVETIKRDASLGTDVDLMVTKAEEPPEARIAKAPEYPPGQFQRMAPAQPQEDQGAAERALAATTVALEKKNAPAALPVRKKKRA